MSGDVVKLKEVSDFVTPSQKCILPFSNVPVDEKKPEDDNLVGVKIKNRKKINLATNGKTRVKVTLEDCLACSGCVTTTELEW